MLPDAALREEFVALLDNAFKKRAYLVLRWMPPTEEITVVEMER